MISAEVMDKSCCIAVGSPRSRGNCTFAANILQQVIDLPCRQIRLADAPVHPCCACGYCNTHAGRCRLDAVPTLQGPDRAAELYSAVCSSSFSLLVIPIYFYHVPAQVKAWIDRSQRWWTLQNPQQKPGYGHTLTAVLLGARPRGEKLFEGAERTLRYMAVALGMTWHTPLCLYGLDEPGALAADSGSQERIRQFAALCVQDMPQL